MEHKGKKDNPYAIYETDLKQCDLKWIEGEAKSIECNVIKLNVLKR